MIRLVCSDRDAPIKLDFGKNFADRDAVRDVLNRLHGHDPKPPIGVRPDAAGAGKSTSKAPAPVAVPISTAERKRREKLLGYPEVMRLHARLVQQTGAITDQQFWDGIKYKFKANGDRKTNVPDGGDEEFARVGTDKGIPSDAFSGPGPAAQSEGIEPKSWPDGIPTPAQRHRIFLLLPVVARAYRSLVPQKKTEKGFWDALSKSSMATKLSKELRFRRSAATSTEADAVFAKFHASERVLAAKEAQAREAALDPTLDMRRFDDHRAPHVLEGHAAVGDAPRLITRPGRRELPSSTHLRIMREVNRHGQIIVDGTSTKGRNTVAESWHKDPQEKGTPLEDLAEHVQPKFAQLSSEAVKKATPVFHPDGTTIQSGPVAESDVADFAASFDSWRCDTSSFMDPLPGSDKVLTNLMQLMKP